MQRSKKTQRRLEKPRARTVPRLVGTSPKIGQLQSMYTWDSDQSGEGESLALKDIRSAEARFRVQTYSTMILNGPSSQDELAELMNNIILRQA